MNIIRKIILEGDGSSVRTHIDLVLFHVLIEGLAIAAISLRSFLMDGIVVLFL